MEKRPPTAAMPYTRNVAPSEPRKAKTGKGKEEEPVKPESNCEHGAGGAAGGDANDARVRHRVAEEPLQGGARGGKGGANDGGHDDAGKPDLLDDELLGAGEGEYVEPQPGGEDA